MNDLRKEVERLKDKDFYISIIRDWKFRWWRESDYRIRASGIDANMIHDLARVLAEAVANQTPPTPAKEGCVHEWEDASLFDLNSETRGKCCVWCHRFVAQPKPPEDAL